MEYDLLHALQPVTVGPERDHGEEVSGYIIIVGGIQQFDPGFFSQPVFSFTSPALYTPPSFSPLSFGPSPDG